MTRDEILAMPAGREMNALIVEKVMKWNVKVTLKDYVIEYPRYSTDIAAAWQVIEKLAHEPYSWDIKSVNLIGGKLNWFVCYWGDGSKPGTILDWYTYCDSLPLAICRVALLAVMEQE